MSIETLPARTSDSNWPIHTTADISADPELQAAPGANKRHRITGFIFSASAVGWVTIKQKPDGGSLTGLLGPYYLTSENLTISVMFPQTVDLDANSAVHANSSLSSNTCLTILGRTDTVI